MTSLALRSANTTWKKNLDKYNGINNNSGAMANEELFNKIIADLPARFHSMFDFDAESDTFTNSVTGTKYHVQGFCKDPRRMSRLLAKTVEEDFYIMCPDKRKCFCAARVHILLQKQLSGAE